mgnify:CR=1 FL=1
MGEYNLKGLSFEWDDEKAKINFARHKITFRTAALVFEDENRVEEYDFDGAYGKDGWQAIGMVENVVLVVFSDREDFTRIISARKATKCEQERYNEMSTVNYFLSEGATPTPEQKSELAALGEQKMLNFDRDCMPFPDVLNWEMDRLYRKYRTRRITKEIWQSEHPDGFFSAPADI